MRQKSLRILEYSLAIVVVMLLLISIAGVVTVKFYGEDLKDYVMAQVNEHIDARVDVEEISVRVFQNFPSTTIVMEKITIGSSHHFNNTDFNDSGTDTLMTAEMVGIRFNLSGMIRGKFRIKKVEISNGSLYLFTNSQGESNYQIFPKQGSKKQQGKLIDIKQLRINNFNVLLHNQAKQLIASGRMNTFDLNGKFSRGNTQIKCSLKGYLEEISNKGILYASDRLIGVRTNLEVHDSVYTIRAGQLQTDRVIADVDGTFIIQPGLGTDLNLVASARDLQIHEVLDLLPGEAGKPAEEIRGNGNLQVYARITGMASSTRDPLVEADFQTTDANVHWPGLPFEIRDLQLKGAYSNGGDFNPASTRLTIESIRAEFGKDQVSGRGRIQNFIHPDFSFELSANLHPGQWIEWFDAIPLYQASGEVSADVKASGSYDHDKSSGAQFTALDVSGMVSLKDVMVIIREEGAAIENLNGILKIDNDHWEQSISGNIGKSDFTIRGDGLNLSSLLKGDKNLEGSVIFRSNYFNLRELLDQFAGKTNEEHPAIVFPANIDLRLDFVINDFVKDLLRANNVRGIARYDSPILYIDSLTMQTMGGTLRGSFGLAQDDQGSIYSNVQASLHNLDIRELFEAFNDFGQKQLTHEHLKGSISGTSIFSAEFDPSFSIQTGSILSENDVTIQEGELNNYAPIMALSNYIEVEELRNIRFQTLNNTILIRDNQVFIPVMDIQSNAINLTASGTHTFSNLFDYRLKLRMSELLYSKSGSALNDEFEIAEDASDTRTLFLKVYDNGSGVTVEIDREQTARKIRDDLKKEKTELKLLLQQELGMFNNGDPLQETDPGSGREETFRFEFPEESDSLPVQDQKPEKGRWRKKKPNSDTLQNKPAARFVIDE